MLTSVYVEGYKGLESVGLDSLSLINIVVGQSSSGKTALLESIRIALSGNPSTMWSTALTRGSFAYLSPAASGDQFEASWRTFFPNFNSDSVMRFWLKDDDGRSATTVGFFDRETSMTQSVQSPNGGPVQSSTYNPLVFDRKSFEGASSRLGAMINPNHGLHVDQGPELGIPSEFLGYSAAGGTMQIADWFSALSIEDLEHEIVRAVCTAFPSVSGLSVQSPNGFAQLYATLNTINRKLPVTSISSGITKFITILLAMSIRRGGVVLIDEIENGIYFKMLPLLWRTIIDFASATGTQVFASTHSWECLSAAAKAFEDDAYLLTLVQVTSREGTTEATAVNGDDAVNAIEADIEVRR
jgi:predicted ATPase